MKRVAALLLALLSLTSLFCTLAPGVLAPAASPSPVPTSILTFVPRTPLPSPTIFMTATQTPVFLDLTTPTAAVIIGDVYVTITARNGSLNIRRGPGVEYNIVGTLLSGQTLQATARTTDGTWLMVPLSSGPAQVGWISTQSEYAQVDGEMLKLLVQYMDPAVPAIIRNCTRDDLAIVGTGIIIPNLRRYPKNEVKVNPGEVKVVDSDMDERPIVFKGEVQEGDIIEITTDGRGRTLVCPQK